MDRRTFIRSAIWNTLTLGALPVYGLFRRFGSEALMQGTGPVEIKVSMLGSAAGCIGEAFCGFSYEKDEVAQPIFTGENRDLIGLFRRLGPGVLRLGGNQADRTIWDRAGAGRTGGKVAPPDLDGVAAFARATGWNVLYGVNLAQSTPELAADEVAYATRALGAGLLGVEIGNEPDCFVGLKYFPRTWGYTDYLARWRAFADAIVRRTPSAVLTGPAIGYKTEWFKSFAADAPKQVRLLTDHYYRADGHLPTSNIPFLLSNPDVKLMNELAAVRGAAEAAKLPFRFAETNSYYNGGSVHVSNSYASALWVIDYLFTLAANGCAGANFHGGGNSTSYTPIADEHGKVIGPRPEYYGIYFFTLAGQGQLRACQYDAAGLNVSVYAVETTSGSLNIMVVNKEPRDVSIALDLKGFGPDRLFRTASVIMMTNTYLSATMGTTIGGSGIGTDGAVTPHESAVPVSADGKVHCIVPPISAALLKLR